MSAPKKGHRAKPLSPKARARFDFELAHGWAALLERYGWHPVKWTKTGRPCLFAYQVNRNEFLFGGRRCFLIGSKNNQGTAWTLRWVHKWIGVKGHNFMVPVQNYSCVLFQTAVGVALWHQLFKPELPK